MAWSRAVMACALAAVALAGCVAPDGADATASARHVPPDPEDVPAGSHPEYGYPVEDTGPENGPPPEQASRENSSDATAAEASEPASAQDDVPDPGDYPESWTRPERRPLPETLSAFEHLAALGASGVQQAAGITLWGHYLFAGDYNPAHLWVIDIMDPLVPVVVAEVADTPMRDADIIAYPDGRLVLVSASGGQEIYVTDVTDPTQPQLLTVIKTANRNHNLAVVPGTPILYNSPSTGSSVDIWDLRDPARPTLAKDWANGAGCHDIYFHVDNDAPLYRGYCAGLDDVQIWDVTSAAEPTIVHEFPFPGFGIEGMPGVSPVTFAHLAFVNHDASVLILGDETGGGVAPACDIYAEAAGTTVSGPLGNLYFYDLSDERDPVLHGHVSPSATDATTSCTAHFGRTIEKRDDLVMAFYTAGILLVNFTDLANPRIVDQWNPSTNTWDAWVYQGYVFTGDLSRGVDVLGFV